MCGTHCIILLLQLELFLSPQSTSPQLLDTCLLHTFLCPVYPDKPLLHTERGGSTGGELMERAGCQPPAQHLTEPGSQAERSIPRRCSSWGTALRWDQNRDERSCAQNGHVFPRSPSSRRRSGGHGLNASDGRSVKAARRGTQRATIHAPRRAMTEAGGERVHGQAESMVIIGACGQ